MDCAYACHSITGPFSPASGGRFGSPRRGGAVPLLSIPAGHVESPRLGGGSPYSPTSSGHVESPREPINTAASILQIPNIVDEIVVLFWGTGWRSRTPISFTAWTSLPSDNNHRPELLEIAIKGAKNQGDVNQILVKAPFTGQQDFAPLHMARLRTAFPLVRIPPIEYYRLPYDVNISSLLFVQDFYIHPIERRVETIVHQYNLQPSQPAISTIIGAPFVADDFADQVVVFFFGSCDNPSPHDRPDPRRPFFITSARFSVFEDVEKVMDTAFHQTVLRGLVRHIAIRVPEYEVLGVDRKIEAFLKQKFPQIPAFDVQSYSEAGGTRFIAHQGTRRVERIP